MLTVESPSTSVIRSRREKRFSFNDQLGTIGGTLGLFTGISLLSMVEVFVLFYILVKSLIHDFFHLVDHCTPSSSLMKNHKDPKDQIDCCDGIRRQSNEKQIKNLYVSQ